MLLFKFDLGGGGEEATASAGGAYQQLSHGHLWRQVLSAQVDEVSQSLEKYRCRAGHMNSGSDNSRFHPVKVRGSLLIDRKEGSGAALALRLSGREV
jgi:hypothetical protein